MLRPSTTSRDEGSTGVRARIGAGRAETQADAAEKSCGSMRWVGTGGLGPAVVVSAGVSARLSVVTGTRVGRARLGSESMRVWVKLLDGRPRRDFGISFRMLMRVLMRLCWAEARTGCLRVGWGERRSSVRSM